MNIVAAITSHLTDDLRRAPWRGDPNHLAGHCYVASEAAFHLLGGRDAGLVACRVRHEGSTHWFLERDGSEIIDITAGQFAAPVSYDERVRTGFLTSAPSKRAVELMRRVEHEA